MNSTIIKKNLEILLNSQNIKYYNIVPTSNTTIKIEETTQSGLGEIHLDITNLVSTNNIVLKIDHTNSHGEENYLKRNFCRICDGLILNINPSHKTIDMIFCELKTTLNPKEIQLATSQLLSAFSLTKALYFDNFNINYTLIIGYGGENINGRLAIGQDYKAKLFSSFINKTDIPFLKVTSSTSFYSYTTKFVKFNNTYKF